MPFIKNQENFTCEHCDQSVTGNGYTNHCPACLWSKHVDITPGDREHNCQGMMEPIGYIIDGGREYITHRCQTCHEEKRNLVAPDDNREIITMLAATSGA